jgi:hypothetical protein
LDVFDQVENGNRWLADSRNDSSEGSIPEFVALCDSKTVTDNTQVVTSPAMGNPAIQRAAINADRGGSIGVQLVEAPSFDYD